jgi:hypothetical protein
MSEKSEKLREKLRGVLDVCRGVKLNLLVLKQETLKNGQEARRNIKTILSCINKKTNGRKHLLEQLKVKYHDKNK